MKMKTIDKIGGLVFSILCIVIIYIFFANNAFFEWAFARHHNTLSWYIRPLFIIPIVVGAFRKSYTIIFASIFCLFTSMFWFPKPVQTDESVAGFLNFEKTYLSSGWSVDKIFVLIAVVLFFVFLVYTTWNRRWKWLLWIIVVSAILKVIHSVIFSGKDGMSIVKPAVLGLIICVTVVCLFFKKRDKIN